MRLYADEDVELAIVDGLRAAHDVVAVVETPYRRRSDAWHLKRASDEERILITFNVSDYRFLHRVWTTLHINGIAGTHSGILTAPKTMKAAALEPLRAVFDSNRNLTGRFLFWNPVVKDWAEDAWRPES
jgi:hypothetical protein